MIDLILIFVASAVWLALQSGQSRLVNTQTNPALLFGWAIVTSLVWVSLAKAAIVTGGPAEAVMYAVGGAAGVVAGAMVRNNKRG